MKDIVICRTKSQLLSFLRRHGYRPYQHDDVEGWSSGCVVHEDEKVYWVTTYCTEHYGEWVTDSDRKLVCLYRPRNTPQELDAAAS